MYKQRVARALLTFQVIGALTFSLFSSAIPVANAEETLNQIADWCQAGVKFDTGEVGTHTINPVTITIVEGNNGKTAVSNVTGNDVVITKVVVKGGNTGGTGTEGNNDYTPPFTYNLIAPNNNGGQQADISHVIVCYDDEQGGEVDYCDPTQRPAGQSIAQWLSENQFNGADCFGHTTNLSCGVFDAQFTKNLTSFNYEFRYALGNTMPVDWQGDGTLPVNFTEDQNGGSVDIIYYAVGAEKDYLVGTGIPNFWDGNGLTFPVKTDCEDPWTGSIGGYKWNDVDGDTLVDNEPRLEGWTIFVDLNNNKMLDDGEPSDITDIDGSYFIDGLALGDHMICEVMQPNWTQTWPGNNGCQDVTLTEQDPNKGPHKNYSFGNKEIEESATEPLKVIKKFCQYVEDPTDSSECKPNEIGLPTSVHFVETWSDQHLDVTIGGGEGAGIFNNELILGDDYSVCETLVDGFTRVAVPDDSQTIEEGCIAGTIDTPTDNEQFGNIVVYHNFPENAPEEPRGTLTIHKQFCAYVAAITPNTVCDPLANHGLSEVTFDVILGQISTPVHISNFDGSTGQVVISDLLPGDYQVCENKVSGFTTIATPNLDQRIDGCVYIDVDGDENHVYFSNFADKPAPTPTPTPAPTPTPTPGQVLGEQVERKPSVLAAVTELPSTSAGPVGLNLVASLVLAAIATRRNLK